MPLFSLSLCSGTEAGIRLQDISLFSQPKGGCTYTELVSVEGCVAPWQCLVVRISRKNNTVPLDLRSLFIVNFLFSFFSREVPVGKMGKMKYAGETFAEWRSWGLESKTSRIPLYNLIFFHSAVQRLKLSISVANHLIESYLLLTALFFTLFFFQHSNWSLDSSRFPLTLITSLVLDSFFTVTFPFLVQSHLCPSAPASSPPGQPCLYPPWIPPTVLCSEEPQAIPSLFTASLLQ